jgi:hypothetical protein
MTEFYDPNQVQVSLGGVLLEGFADGTMIEVEPASDDYESKVGTKGDVGVARIYNPLSTVKIRFLQTSTANDQLSTLRNSSRAAAASGFASAFSMRDASGTTKVQGTAWIQKRPTATMSNTIEAREWTLTVRETSAFIGGNTSAP